VNPRSIDRLLLLLVLQCEKYKGGKKTQNMHDHQSCVPRKNQSLQGVFQPRKFALGFTYFTLGLDEERSYLGELPRMGQVGRGPTDTVQVMRASHAHTAAHFT
jgi:hypothetical protein